LEPDYLLADGDGNASASGSLETNGQVFTTISRRIIIPGWIGTTGLVENDGRIFVRAEPNHHSTWQADFANEFLKAWFRAKAIVVRISAEELHL